MNKTTSDPQPAGGVINRIWLMLLAVGPGIFCVGYTIGTGSVTSMTKAGSMFGMQLLWVLVLSCFFSWVLMEAYGRFGIATGLTSIQAFKTQFRFGKPIAILTAFLVIAGQWCCLSGLVGLSSGAIHEALCMVFPSLSGHSYTSILSIAILVMAVMYLMLWFGNYGRFEKILVFFVTIMGVAFIVSMSMVFPGIEQIASGLIPSIPDRPDARMMVAAFVGTTMAAPTFVVRPLLLQGKGWGKADHKRQSRDAMISATIMFIVSGAIMACATGAILLKGGQPIEKVLDMVQTLEPIAGRFAVVLFLVGTLSAGLSSVFPIAMVAPLLVGDYRNGRIETATPTFRILTGIACLLGLVVPICGINPIFAQILTQIAQVFVLPIVIGGMLILCNRRKLMGEHRAGILLNVGMVAALGFSLVISYNAYLALSTLVRSI
jgi:manganese transport protein